jgi:hypothetical protein
MECIGHVECLRNVYILVKETWYVETAYTNKG